MTQLNIWLEIHVNGGSWLRIVRQAFSLFLSQVKIETPFGMGFIWRSSFHWRFRLWESPLYKDLLLESPPRAGCLCPVSLAGAALFTQGHQSTSDVLRGLLTLALSHPQNYYLHLTWGLLGLLNSQSSAPFPPIQSIQLLFGSLFKKYIACKFFMATVSW